MQFADLINARRSVRGYVSPASCEDLRAMLTMAQRAPSWKNWQASRCYVASSPEALAAARAALPGFNQNSSANAALIVTTFVRGQVGHTDGQPDNDGADLWGAYDLGLHDAYLVLAAADLGYDTLIMGLRDAHALHAALDIPANEQVMSVIAVGKRREDAPLRPRKALDEVAFFR